MARVNTNTLEGIAAASKKSALLQMLQSRLKRQMLRQQIDAYFTLRY
jgi:hypothetical protein